MSTGATGLGFTPNVARQIAAQRASSTPNPNQNNSQAQASQGQRISSTPLTNSPAPASTAVAAPGSAPAPSVGGTTSPAAAATARTAPNAPIAMPITGFPAAMAAFMKSGVASQAVIASGVGESKDKNKDEVNKAVNRAKEVGEKSGLALQGDNSAVGEEAAKTGGSAGASGPGAAAA